MVWRSVMISRPAKLRREHYSLAIEQEETAFVPFEDIVRIPDHRDRDFRRNVTDDSV